VGQAVGLLIIASGVGVAIATGDLFEFLWPAFIGWFLFRAASGAVVEGDRQRLLRATTVGEVMSAPPPSIPADLQVAVALERYLLGHEGEAFPVIEDGHVVGFVSPRTARTVPLDRDVRDAMVQGRGVIEARPEETMAAVTERLGQQRGETVLVLDQGRLVGVIEREDLSRFFRRRIGLPARTGGGQPGPRPDGGQPGQPESQPSRPDGP
jgi:CBS domain-containing protein